MTSVLYFNPYSQHSRKVLVLAEELDIDLERKSIEVRPRGYGGETAKPEFLAINPNGKVPVLKEGDFILWESNAIAWYLAEKQGWSELWPQDLRERAEIAKWQLWQVAHLSPTLDGLLWESMKKMVGAGEPDEQQRKRHLEGLGRWGEVLSINLAERDYLACGRFTLADIAVSSAAMHDKLAGFSFRDFPAVQRWLDRVQARASWEATNPPPMGAAQS